MNNFIWSDPPSQTAFPVAKAGYGFLFAAAFTTFIFALLEFITLAIFGLLATFFICYFFRDPDRLVSRKEGVVVSPADGKIISAGGHGGQVLMVTVQHKSRTVIRLIEIVYGTALIGSRGIDPVSSAVDIDF